MIVLKPHVSFSLSNSGPWILFALWLIVQGTVFLHYGIVQSADSDLYLTNAHALLQGHFPADRGIWYSSYSLFLAFVFFAGGNLTVVVLLQLLCSGLAAMALYKTVQHLFHHTTTSFLAVLQYLLWIKIHQWNSYLYTESLFISCSIISFAMLSLSSKKWHYLLTAVVLVFTLFLRPTGICFLVGICGYLLFIGIQKKHLSKITLLMITVTAFVIILILLNNMLKEYIFYFIDSYSKAELIYPNINLGFIPPEQLHKPSPDHMPLLQLAEFMIYNPGYFLQLSLMKFLLFLGNVKPYFSWAHNLLIVVVLYPIYLLALYGYTQMAWNAEKVFMVCFIIMQTLTVSMTSENWDGRFLILILPFIFIYSAVGITSLWKRYELKKTNVLMQQK